MLRTWITAGVLATAMASAAAQDAGRAAGVAMSMDQAIVLRMRLEDDVLVLRRAVHLQDLLLAWNGVRALRGLALATLPRELCRSPALAPHCAALPSTFGGAQ